MTAASSGNDGVSVLFDPGDDVAASPPVRWAMGELRQAFAAQNVAAQVEERSRPRAAAAGPALTVIVAGPAAARETLDAAGVVLPDAAEALALVPLGGGALLAAGADVRGLVYAVLELADRVRYAGGDPLATLRFDRPIVDRPANAIRSIARLFTSDVEDKPWFYDRDFWPAYLTELTTQRLNRFSLTLGLGYNFPRHVSDAYFYFSYPFLLEVPGFNVRVPELPDAERDRNMDTLRFIGEEVKRRGLHFQLALWTHAYEWQESAEANYTVEGLTPETHAAYCRAAVRELLARVPTIDGVTFRVHGESGIPEGSYDFWRELFAGVRECGRPVEIDMHAKGIDQRTIDIALETGLPVVVSPKYWAEHMGLPYHQAWIRPLERFRGEGSWERSFMALSAGSRRFTRYGYADLLPEDRRHGILYRIWPGTQRHLLWGDPAMAAGYGRYAHIAGCQGVEWCEPLSFKGRMGSGLAGGRLGYADETLTPEGGAGADWEKFRYTYRVWGRLLYNPQAEPDTWRRYLRHELGPAAEAAEAALAQASRILLLVTTAYHPSASNNRYWPEIYTNLPITYAGADGEPSIHHPYGDTPSPKRFGTATALDPELFSGVDEFVEEALSGAGSGRVSPLEVARWLEGCATRAGQHLAEAVQHARAAETPAFRRLAADVAIQSAVGLFFAEKLRAGVAYALYKRTGSGAALSDAMTHYRAARDAWASAAEHGKVYRDDLTYGREPWLRGHWADRLPDIDQDLAAMEGELKVVPPAAGAAASPRLKDLDFEAPGTVVEHTPLSSFRRGEPVPIELGLAPGDRAPKIVYLRFRHLNQAESYEEVEMARASAEDVAVTYQATIPSAYSQSPYALQYFFRLQDADGHAWLFPGFAPDLANQPYFVIRQAGYS